MISVHGEGKFSCFAIVCCSVTVHFDSRRSLIGKSSNSVSESHSPSYDFLSKTFPLPVVWVIDISSTFALS